MIESGHKPALNAGQIWNMSFGFLGIQIGFELQNGNVSRIFQTLGADVGELAILWIAAPMTGLIVQPIIGHLSDKTWGPLGRRRPYFLVGAILASLALFVMPNAPALWVLVTNLFGGAAIYAMVIAAASFVLAAVATLFVADGDAAGAPALRTEAA